MPSSIHTALLSRVVASRADREIVAVDTSDVRNADDLSAAFVRQTTTDPPMDPAAGMRWDALVDSLSGGFALEPLAHRRLLLVVGPLDALRTSSPADFETLLGSLDQLAERSDVPALKWPRMVTMVHGSGMSFGAPTADLPREMSDEESREARKRFETLRAANMARVQDLLIRRRSEH